MRDTWIAQSSYKHGLRANANGLTGTNKAYAESNYVTEEQMAFINNVLRDHPEAKFEDYIEPCMEQNLQLAFQEELEDLWQAQGAHIWKQTEYGNTHHTSWEDLISEKHHTGSGTTCGHSSYPC